MLRRKLLPTFNGVANGEPATCDLTLGIAYHVAWLKLGDDGTASAGNAGDINATLDNLGTDVKVKLNGKDQRIATLSQLNKVQAVNGAAFAAKDEGTAGTAGYRVHLPIFFAQPWRKQNGGSTSNPQVVVANQVSAHAWHLTDVRSAQIEVKFDGAAIGGTPKVEGYYEWAPATRSIGSISKMYRDSLPAIGDTTDFNTLFRGVKDTLTAMHFFPTVGGTSRFVEKLKVTAGGIEYQDLLTNEDNQAILLGREMNPDTSATPRYDWVLDYDDPIGGLLLDGLSEFNAHVEYSGSANGNLPLITLRDGPPD